VGEVALLLELFDEFAELFGEAVHGALEAGQQVERHDDGEARRWRLRSAGSVPCGSPSCQGAIVGGVAKWGD